MKIRQPMAVKVHDSECHGYDLGNAAAEWFAKKISIPCRLVSYAREKPRYVDPNYAQECDKVGFADGMQALVTSTSSLKSLH